MRFDFIQRFARLYCILSPFSKQLWRHYIESFNLCNTLDWRKMSKKNARYYSRDYWLQFLNLKVFKCTNSISVSVSKNIPPLSGQQKTWWFGGIWNSFFSNHWEYFSGVEIQFIKSILPSQNSGKFANNLFQRVIEVISRLRDLYTFSGLALGRTTKRNY